jgi:hypothetical protein
MEIIYSPALAVALYASVALRAALTSSAMPATRPSALYGVEGAAF